MRDGLVDLSYVTASYTPARHILPLMAELPGAGATAEINSVAYSRIYWKYFHKVGEYNGVKLLGVWTHGPGQMFTKKPIKTLADFKGLKIRTGGGIAEAVANALGTSAFVKPAPESYELLNSGVADGVFFPLESIVSFKLDKVIGQATVFPGGLYSSSFGFFMNEDKWNKLSKQDQDIIEKFSGEYVARRNGKSWDNADKVGLDALKKAGAQHRAAPNAAMVAEAKKRTGPIIEDWIKKASAKGTNAKAILDGVPRRAEEGRGRASKPRTPDNGRGSRPRPFFCLTHATSSASGKRRIDAVLGIAASVLLFGMMLLTFADVVGALPVQLPAPRRLRGHRAHAAGADLRRPAAGVARRRARHDGFHRPHAAAGRPARAGAPGARAVRRDHVLPDLADLAQGRQDLRLRRHHRRAAHRGRARSSTSWTR